MKAASFRALCAFLLTLTPAIPAAFADRNSDYWKPENMAKRQCTSVHLVYRPSSPNTTAVYSEMVVNKSAPGSYFAGNNFSCGYIGVQELVGQKPDGRPLRVAIFSVWDAKDTGDNPHAAPEEERAKLIRRGDRVMTQRFGGEGTGGKSMRLFDWKEGDVIRTLVVQKKDADDFRQIAGYIYDPATERWELISCWRVQSLTPNADLGDSCGFVEDFCRNVESKSHERCATFGPIFAWNNRTGWSEKTQFTFTRDANPNNNICCTFDPKRGYFSLSTGGNVSVSSGVQPFSDCKLDASHKADAPGADVTNIVRSPKLAPVHYTDDGTMQ